ncbi:MAG: vanadium-dependent haloperoxidase [Rhodothermia bacterium]|nr:vanadium-dependent haloperoxidase [Rhodothermia bacterium]
MVHDIFSPPQAARGYAYPAIAAYEALAAGNPSYRSLAGQLQALTDLPSPKPDADYVFEVAAIHSFLMVARAIVFSEDRIGTFHEEIHGRWKEMGIPSDVRKRSMAFGDEIANHVIAWANTDNYKETRTFPKYTVEDEPGRWIPTPPAYIDGIEPHWNKIRPFVLSSADQFIPPPPTPYSVDKDSQFFREALEVYEVGINLSDEQAEIAAFWDCNPYVMNTRGHVMFATKKITPGGHWIGITAIASRLAQADMVQAAEAYALTAIAISDAFISSWDEKYRSNLVRPETVINRHIDEEWIPLLQTPPFPEYTSGHSVISTAAAIALTEVYGDNFAFADTTEVEYGLPVRSFNSFMEASAEAAISRLYGGIHYRPAVEDGVDQGGAVGNYVTNNLTLRLNPLATHELP